ncbi:Pre-mRNA-splicing factor SLU7 [Porphyridium purpureum]|uniref:Pre-mRNA-splicing factor SLU7 n=1 Tax=Porphyridium purpureum TaxID=35688 RepID=A0A5J4Z023_PORPP|nr:Pre-mRNA-splicing factor SLU7 [Porphyridium purpureum]|eukprot:POR3634..scf208_2
MASSSQRVFQTRDEYKKRKELEEARRMGRVAPEVDEDGNDINPHIPQYISQAPWYLNQDGPGLKHQKKDSRGDVAHAPVGSERISTWNARRGAALTSTQPLKKFAKGACENCGASTHKARDCLERPRLKKAKLLGVSLCADDQVQDTLGMDYEGKRDQWSAFDVARYDEVIEKHQKLEERRLRALEQQRQQQQVDEVARDEFKQLASNDVVVQEKDVDTKGVTRNLRIREDTAKYLRNLSQNSAYYDPKSRSMRQDPTPQIDLNDKDYAGDAFVLHTGDVRSKAQLELHTLRANELGYEMPHLVAEPSLAELAFREFQKKREALDEARRTEILAKYGVPDAVRIGQAELHPARHESSIISVPEDGVRLGLSVPSKYQEDVLFRNHRCIWGSFYEEGRWGYQCCQQTVRNSFCTGEHGIRARMLERARLTASTLRDSNTCVPQSAGEASENPEARSKQDTKADEGDRLHV